MMMHGLANVKKGTTSVSPHVVKIAGISSFNRLFMYNLDSYPSSKRLKTLQHLGGFYRSLCFRDGSWHFVAGFLSRFWKKKITGHDKFFPLIYQNSKYDNLPTSFAAIYV